MKASAFLSSRRRQWAASFVIAALLLAVSFALCRPLYETNDDSCIVASASGAVTGSPYAGNGFTSYLYGMLLSGLFTLCASLPWHACILLATLYLAITAIVQSTLAVSVRYGVSLYAALAVLGALYAGVLMPYVVMLQFTTVSAIAACGGVCLLLTHSRVSAGGQSAAWIIAVLLLLISFGLRIASFWVAVPLLVAYSVLEWIDSKGREKKTFFSVLLIVSGFAVLTAADSLLYRTLEPGWNTYAPFNALLTSFLDYNNVGAISEIACQSTDWSPELAWMIRNWYMLDPKLNTENLTALLACVKAASPVPTVLSVLRATGSIVLHYPMFALVLAGFVLVSCWAFLCFWHHKQWTLCLRLLGTGAYLLVFIGFFYGVLGRLPARAAFTAAAPCYTLLALTCLRAAGQTERRRSFSAIAAVCFACCVLTPVLHSDTLLTFRWIPQSRDDARAFSADICEYAAENPDWILVTNMPLDHDPFYVYKDDLPSNLIEWCHGMYHSPMYQTKLSRLGFDSFTSQDLFGENVRILVADREMLDGLLAYLQAEYGQAAVYLEQAYDTFGVYRLVLL